MSEAKPPESLLPYSDWAEEALRAVVREAVAHAAAAGLPGEHHFFITFRTDAPGVSLPTHLLARFPQEMTIVLQNKFWGLTVDRATDRLEAPARNAVDHRHFFGDAERVTTVGDRIAQNADASLARLARQNGGGRVGGTGEDSNKGR